MCNISKDQYELIIRKECERKGLAESIQKHKKIFGFGGIVRSLLLLNCAERNWQDMKPETCLRPLCIYAYVYAYKYTYICTHTCILCVYLHIIFKLFFNVN